jgi:4-hydroxyphenylpyruvate dioxygenase
MGLCGFEFVEFASPTPNTLEPLFEQMGFSLVAKHRSKDVVLYRQGDINLIVNREPKSLAGCFAAEHGPCACALAFRVKDSHLAYARAPDLGAQPVDVPTSPMELRLPAIEGIGGAPLYLIDRFEDGKSIDDIDFEFIDGVDRHPPGVGLRLVDHPTHNVYKGLTSRAMTAPNELIRITQNEASGKT